MRRHHFAAIFVFITLITLLGAAPLWAQATAVGSRGMVASVDGYATAVGVEILKKGGNAVDAAVAVSLALAVTHPQAGNLGGGGFLVIYLREGGIETTVDYREKAPLAGGRDMYLDAEGEVIEDASLYGYLAAGVPGQVAGLWLAHRKYGSLPWRELVEPAIRLARDGIEVDYWLAGALARGAETMADYPSTARIFLKDGEPHGYGELLKQADLAWTLEQVAARGHDGFYKGEVARKIAADMAANGGLITEEDLARYEAVERPPVTGEFHGYRIVGMGPPSSGGMLLLQMLGLLEGYEPAGLGLNSSRYVQLLTEAEKLAFADRAEYMGDIDFYPVPAEMLVSPDYIEERRREINLYHATPSERISAGEAPAEESEETTHFSVVDGQGNAVACTTTLNGGFGSYAVAEGTGVLLNNEMDDFSIKPGFPNMYGLIGSEANAIAPGKRMLSSMTPTIVLEDGEVRLVVGSPGGSTIPTTVLQVTLNVLEHGLPLQAAVAAPRFHHQWMPDRTYVEARGWPEDVLEALGRMGHTVYVRQTLSGRKLMIGDVHAIYIEAESGLMLGVSDPRGGGVAKGVDEHSLQISALRPLCSPRSDLRHACVAHRSRALSFIAIDRR